MLFRDREVLAKTHRMVQVHLTLDLGQFREHCAVLLQLVQDVNLVKHHPDWTKRAGKTLATQCDHIQMWPTFSSHFHRQERQVVALAALGLLGVLGITALSRNDDSALLSHLEAHDHVIGELASNMAAINSTLFLLMRENILKEKKQLEWNQLSQIDSLINQNGFQITTVSQGLATLQGQKLSPGLLAPGTLRFLYNNMTSLAYAHALRLPISQPYMLYEFPASYRMFSDHKLEITLHVPLIANTYQLKQYVPFPIEIETANGSFPFLPKPELDLVAETADSSSHDFFFLSYAYLHACFHLQNYFFCPHLFTPQNTSETKCSAALYYGQQDHLHLCPLEHDERSWVLEQLSQDNFYLYSRTPIAFEEHCGRDRYMGAYGPGFTRIAVKVGCAIKTQYFSIPSLAVTYLPMSMRKYIWNVSARIRHSADTSKFQEALEHIRRKYHCKVSMSDVLRHIDELKRADRPPPVAVSSPFSFLQSEWARISHYASSVLLFLIVLGLLGFLRYLYKASNHERDLKGQKQTTPSGSDDGT